MLIQPVILSGGTGTRLWPLSRTAYPKQLLPLSGPKPMLIETARRVADPGRFAPVMVVASEEHRFIIAEEFRQDRGPGAARLGRLVLEPAGRNTAPALTAAALLARAQDQADAVLLILPADHHIGDRAAFDRAITAGAAAASAGHIVTLGMTPDHPATGYGYIRRGAALDGLEGAFQVEAFVEKPSRDRAESYIADGGYFWNSGMFLLRADLWLAEVAQHRPDILPAVEAAVAKGTEDLDFLRLDPESFKSAPNISIDYAVMEKTRHAAIVPAEFGWNDIGAWSELWRVAERDAADNARFGPVVDQDSRGCYLRSEGPLVAAIGIENLVVVATKDSVLVVPRDRAQDVGALVKDLAARGRPEASAHALVHRPWGTYESVDQGNRYQVKRITVKPGQRLSLQKHFHRAEHWVVVQGSAQVHRDGEEILVTENQSVYLPLGAVHRLFNPGKIDLHLIEVQSGSYLGEDDIVRLQDDYRRN